ncbi:hypothetical protein BVRB_5g115590 [Beta vulgaris subsp. vulgaris]|nr:hypothetical protein BVRB_5g115590 [Beta vulgaris subsp. vulgaris]
MLVENKVINTTSLNLYKIISKKLQVIGEKSERFKDELLITLVGVTGQNAMQMPWSSAAASSSGLKYVAMVANCMAFISLLSGVLLRSKGAIEGHARRRVASNMLVMLGILLTAAGPMLNISMNIPGVGGYFVPLICLLPIIGVCN